MLQNVPKKLKRQARGFAHMVAKRMGQALRESADLIPPTPPPFKLPVEGVALAAFGSSFQPFPACPPPANTTRSCRSKAVGLGWCTLPRYSSTTSLYTRTSDCKRTVPGEQPPTTGANGQETIGEGQSCPSCRLAAMISHLVFMCLCNCRSVHVSRICDTPHALPQTLISSYPGRSSSCFSGWV
jgi:hypothetical protein